LNKGTEYQYVSRSFRLVCYYTQGGIENKGCQHSNRLYFGRLAN